MEEILASIRKIISDEPAAAAKPAPAAAVAEAPAAKPEPAASQDAVDDIFNSVEVEEDDSDEMSTDDIDRLMAAEPAAADDGDEAEDEAADESEEVMELTEDMVAEEDAAPHMEMVNALDDEVGFAEEQAAAAPEPEPVRAAPPPRPAAAKPAAAAAPEALLSADSSEAVRSAFSSLAGMMLSNNSRTIDDLVADMLRPMLKQWLDDNLPTLVEKIVRAEIERVTRGR